MPKTPPKPLHELIPWEQYTREVEDTLSPDTIDLEDAVAMAQKAVERWGQQDYEACLARHMSIVGVETKFVAGISTGTRDLDIAYPDGSRLIVDWKTAYNLSGEKLDNWIKRHERSWQHDIYARSLGIDPHNVLFEYRGVSRKMETATIPIAFEPHHFRNAHRYLCGTVTAIESQIDSTVHTAAWPKNKPNACGAYGRACPEIAAGCLAGNDPPFANVQLISDSLRYSHAGLFWLCPERYRREMIRVHEKAVSVSRGREMFDDAFEPPLLGTLLHAFMERIYRRIQELTT